MLVKFNLLEGKIHPTGELFPAKFTLNLPMQELLATLP